MLGGPGPGRGGRLDAVLAAAQDGAEAGPVLVGPCRFDQLGAEVGVAALVIRPRWTAWPEEYSEGTRPVKPPVRSS